MASKEDTSPAASARPARKVPPGRPFFSEDSIQFVVEETRRILTGEGFLSTATHVKAFEEEFAALSGTRHGVAVNSGTVALEHLLRALDVEGGEVIVPSLTFGATAHAAIAAGARPAFADNGLDMQMDPDSVAKRLGPQTRAVVTVHVGGYLSSRLDELAALCEERGVPFVEDASHAHGAQLGGKPAGSFGKAAAFSLFSTKVVTTGEGGVVTTDDEAIAEKVRLLRNNAKDGNKNYHSSYGTTARMTEMQALVGRAQLREVRDQTAARARIARVYDDRLEGAAGLTVYREAEGLEPSYYKYVAYLEHPGRQREAVERLRELGVRLTGFTYELPLHHHPYFAPYAEGQSFPGADDVALRHICLPIHPGMNEEDAAFVADTVKEVAADLKDLGPVEGGFLLP